MQVSWQAPGLSVLIVPTWCSTTRQSATEIPVQGPWLGSVVVEGGCVVVSLAVVVDCVVVVVDSVVVVVVDFVVVVVGGRVLPGFGLSPQSTCAG